MTVASKGRDLEMAVTRARVDGGVFNPNLRSDMDRRYLI
jgi:hypothetical protein